MSWQILTFISIVTFSISVLLQRVLLHKDKGDPDAYAVLFMFTVGIVTLLYALVQGFVMPDFGKYWLPALACCILFGRGHILYAKSLQHVEASIFSILFATHALWAGLAGVVIFHESLSITQLVGIALIVASIAILVERKDGPQIDRSIWLGLFTGFVFGLAVTTLAYVGQYSDPASWSALSFIGPGIVILISRPRSVYKMKPFFSGGMLFRMLSLGTLFSIAAVTMLMAFDTGEISVIAPLRQISTILTIILAVILLHERDRLWQKAIAAAVCFVGVLLIV